MKTTKTKLGFAALTLILIFFIASSFNKPDAESKYATVRLIEAAMGKSKIVIAYEDGKTEEFELEKFRADNYGPNLVKINTAFNDLAKKGYEMVASTGGDYISTFTFVKK